MVIALGAGYAETCKSGSGGGSAETAGESQYGAAASTSQYSNLSAHINRLKQQICEQLDQPGKACLEQLADTYMRQETVILRDAFSDGFWSAVELMLEFQQRKSKHK